MQKTQRSQLLRVQAAASAQGMLSRCPVGSPTSRAAPAAARGKGSHLRSLAGLSACLPQGRVRWRPLAFAAGDSGGDSASATWSWAARGCDSRSETGLPA